MFDSVGLFSACNFTGSKLDCLFSCLYFLCQKKKRDSDNFSFAQNAAWVIPLSFHCCIMRYIVVLFRRLIMVNFFRNIRRRFWHLQYVVHRMLTLIQRYFRNLASSTYITFLV